MRLEVSRRADLAVRALVTLRRTPGRVKAVALAEELETTVGFVPQVVGPLVKRGWVGTAPGPTGGYAAVPGHDTTTVLDVIEAVDGPTDRGHCVVVDRPCGRGAHCALHDAWDRARDALVSELAATRVADLVEAGVR